MSEKFDIAIPYWPGSNGAKDAVRMTKFYGMNPLPLYFHIGHGDFQENLRTLSRADGVILPGGFPFEDRLGFGKVPAKLTGFARVLKQLRDERKPILAFCSGNQIAHAMDLVFDENSHHKISMEPNICDRDGKIVWQGFRDDKIHTKLVTLPERTAFTREYSSNQVIQAIIDHGGGRFWADSATLEHLVNNDMVAMQYCDEYGKIIDNFPVNPNGSLASIEAVTNPYGNVLIGMVHHERVLNALQPRDPSTLMFESMRGYIEEDCPDLSPYIRSSSVGLSSIKTFDYLRTDSVSPNSIEIYIRMLTDDNSRNTASLFLGEEISIQRRRLLKVEVNDGVDRTPDLARRIVEELAKMDFLDGIMLKKDVPTFVMPDGTTQVYTKISGDSAQREFRNVGSVVEDHNFSFTQIPDRDPLGYSVTRKIQRNSFLNETVSRITTGESWFFMNDNARRYAQNVLFN